MSAPRQFLVPKALCSAGMGASATLDDMEFYAQRPGPGGDWAKKVLARENARVLDELLGDESKLPRGVLASAIDTGGAEVVTALVNHKRQTWTPASGWVATSTIYTDDNTLELDDNDVAFITRALREGSDGVVMRACMPLAFVSAAPPPGTSPPTGMDTLPSGAVVVAIVDPIDKEAVLEELAVTPGPGVLRRHDGKWYEDANWVKVLASIRPPTMVKLTPDQTTSVASQVDQATQGQPFMPFQVTDAGMYTVNASAYVHELEREADQRGIDWNLALLAVAGRELSPKDVASTERLRRYWLFGEGAAKIRWFTPGSWTRCYRHLVKYVGPLVAPGLCTNMSERLGGPGVATHVGIDKPIPGPL